MYNCKTSKGFTLIELSIVVVIIGLAVAGVLVGSNMRDTARLNQLISDLTSYRTSYEQFKNKYSSVPGDMVDAESYWGAGNTNNGDGDWQIVEDTEEYLAWQHLGLSGFLKNTLSGSRSLGGSNAPILGVEIPQGPYNLSGYRMVEYDADLITGVNYVSPANSIVAAAVGVATTDSKSLKRGVVSPQDAYSLDLKIDDGLPHQGKILGPRATSPFVTINCSVTQGDINSEYLVSNTEKDCQIVYLLEDLDE